MDEFKFKKLMEKLEYELFGKQCTEETSEEEKKKIKRSECPYGGIDCANCFEDCEAD